MARRTRRPAPTQHLTLPPAQYHCWECHRPLWTVFHTHRTVTTLDAVLHLTLPVRRCQTPTCPRFRQSLRPEAEGRLALPHGEFGLDVIALIGLHRYRDHRSVPEIHQALVRCGVVIAERTVTNLLARYEELVALHLRDDMRLRHRLAAQGAVVLAIDGMQPDAGHEVLWVIRDCLSGAVLLARSLLSSTTDDLAPLLGEVRQALPVPVRAVISDGQTSIRHAVAAALPGVPHQLCQFHYLREAARPVSEADRHAKKELKKQVRGVRPIERAVEGAADADAAAVRAYCQAVRSAITDDGPPPLAAAGLKLVDRLHQIHDSIARMAVKRGSRGRYDAFSGCWPRA